MPKKGFAALSVHPDTYEKVSRFAANLGISRAALIALVFKDIKHALVIPIILNRIANAKISGPFVRKREGKLERYSLVDDEEVVTDTWTAQNIDNVAITE